MQMEVKMVNIKRAGSGRGSLNPRPAPAVLGLIVALILTGCSGSGGSPAEGGSGDGPVIDGDLVIGVADISESAKFYPVEVDGTKLEVIAVEAPDGTIRTAFNTCQVCYDSGRGYYRQDGGVLVCQNCGNRFDMSQVEVVAGGCNPVPIFPDNKTVTDETITVPLDFLREAKVIFSNWRGDY
jgi:hypothetical protein